MTIVGQSLLRFWHWWLTGLLHLVPDNLREALTPRRDELIISANNRTLDFRHVRQNEEVREWSMDRGDELAVEDCRRRLAGDLQPDTGITVCVPEEAVLIKSLSLPLATTDNLREVLGFEMDRQTPFQVDKVYYDWRELDRDKDRIHVELVVVLKEFLEPLMEKIHSLQIEPDKATVDRPGYDRINLLPGEQRQRPMENRNKLTWLLGTATLVLFLCALYLPLLRYESAMDRLETRVNTLRNQAKTVQALAQEKQGVQSRTRFLAEKRAERAPAIDVLNELTSILPDNTWVSRLTIRDNEIQIYGESETATALIETIEESDLFSEARFDAPVTKNARSRKDRYQISATIDVSEEES